MSGSSQKANTAAEPRVPSLAPRSRAAARGSAERQPVPVRRVYWLSLAVWFGLALIAIVNGAVRELVLVRLVGPAALPVSGLTAITAFGIAIAVFIRMVRPTVAVAARVGAGWLALTLAAETLMTLAAGHPAHDVLAALTPAALARGNLMLLLLLVTTLAPAAFARALAPQS